jgi:hypothetical protein
MGSKVVEHSSHDLKFEDLNTTTTVDKKYVLIAVAQW